MRIITCDRCGQTIQQGVKPWAFAICNGDTGEPYPGNPFKEWDFCLGCKDEIIDFCKTKPVKIVKPKAVPETPESPKKTVPLDRGKIFALRKANWSLTEIAKEMGCSVGTVSKICTDMLQKEKQEKKK